MFRSQPDLLSSSRTFVQKVDCQLVDGSIGGNRGDHVTLFVFADSLEVSHVTLFVFADSLEVRHVMQFVFANSLEVSHVTLFADSLEVSRA